jgi:glycosyltransferase involved in cell wall biosynthesis
MKVAFVSLILGYPWGGADALWTSAAEVAANRGDSLLLAVSELVAPHPRVRALADRGAVLHVRPASGRAASLVIRAARKVARRLGGSNPLLARIRAFAPDLLVFSCGGTYDPILEPELCAWLRSSGTRYRIVANFQDEHPAFSEPDREQAREALIHAERLFFVSRRNLEITRRHLLHPLPSAECIHGCMVYNPILPGAAVPWPPESEPRSFAAVARLEREKGLDLLLAALADGLGEIPGWRLRIYGRGPQRGYLERSAAYLGLAERVRFPGFVPSLDDIWAANHILVSPALNEGGPMTLPEAMLRGRTAIATRVGAAEEWIEHGRTGFLCPAPEAGLLAATLREAWEQRGRWREMGALAAERSRSLYRANDYERIVA